MTADGTQGHGNSGQVFDATPKANPTKTYTSPPFQKAQHGKINSVTMQRTSFALAGINGAGTL